VQDLSKPVAFLVPSSQEGGNLVDEQLAKHTMTAPGSAPVTPLPDPHQQADPIIEVSHNDTQAGPLGLPDLIPVADTKHRTGTANAVPLAAPVFTPTPAGPGRNLNVPYPGADWQGEMPDA
jgi:hypothetical protein